MSSPLLDAARDVLRAQCRRHQLRALRRLEVAADAQASGEDPFADLMRAMVELLEDQEDDPLAVALVERARALGVTSK